MEEVHGRDADRGAGPCEDVLVAGRYVEDPVGDLPEEGGHLGGCDQPARAGVWVAVNHSRVVVRHAEALCLPDDVEARLCGAHPVRIRAMAVREGLAIFIVLLFSEAEQSEDHVMIGQ